MNDEETAAHLTHIYEDLHTIEKKVTEMHAALEEFRPLLKVLKSGTAVERAGLARMARKAAKGG